MSDDNVDYDGLDEIKPCIFPWKHKNTGDKLYHGCANPDNSPEGNWCPVVLPDDGVYVTGYANYGMCNNAPHVCHAPGEVKGGDVGQVLF